VSLGWAGPRGADSCIGSGSLLAEFQEVESGKRHDNRPQLAAALERARKHGAVLVIAKLDRLARNVAFVANLMESGVEFQAVDMPYANKLTILILAAVAEHEREAISERKGRSRRSEGTRHEAGQSTLEVLTGEGEGSTKSEQASA
jgi:DNA invertase Pin-like site-specific DNA recombinase